MGSVPGVLEKFLFGRLFEAKGSSQMGLKILLCHELAV